MNKQIIRELKDLSPELAELKKHHHQIDMPLGYQTELFQHIKSELPKGSGVKTFNLSILGAIAASCLVIIAYFSLLNPSSTTDYQKDELESYVLDNLDEFEDIMVNEEEIESWLSKRLEDIPETDLVSYLEKNLDHLDLDIQY